MLKRSAASYGVNLEIRGPQKKEGKENQVLINKIGGLSNGLVMVFHTNDLFYSHSHSRCEGVGWDSGLEHEGSHLMHDIDISYNSK